MPIEYRCEYCGEKNTKAPSRYEKTDKHYCDKKCMYKDRENDVEKECEMCGEKFKSPKSKKQKYCSRKCYADYRSENIVAENHPQWKENYRYYYGTNWEKQREKARKRDDYKCVVCGKTKEKTEDGKLPHIHHIKPIREFKNVEEANKLENLVSLCREHHLKYEGKTDITVKELKQKND